MTMDTEARRQLVHDSWVAAWDKGDVDAFDALLAPGYRRRSSPNDEGETLVQFKASIVATRSAFPDLLTTIDDILIEADRVAVRWHSAGHHERPFLGVPATNRRVEVSGATFGRFQDDRIIEEFVTWDPRALLTALGIISVGADR
jgi:steroid delta-isomerase-like uncharacterized protein